MSVVYTKRTNKKYTLHHDCIQRPCERTQAAGQKRRMTHRQSQFLSVVGTWHWQPVPVGSFDTWTDVGWCWWGHVDVRGAIGGSVKRTNCALTVPDGVYQLKPTYSHLSHVRRRPALQFHKRRSDQQSDHEEEVHLLDQIKLLKWCLRSFRFN